MGNLPLIEQLLACERMLLLARIREADRAYDAARARAAHQMQEAVPAEKDSEKDHQIVDNP